MKKKVFRFKTLKQFSEQARLLSFVGRGGGDGVWVGLKASGPARSRQRFSLALSRLVLKKMLEVKRDEDLIKAKLTKLGVIEFLKLELVLVEELPKGFICLVVFDIPEKFSALRNLVRWFLKENCFFPLQKSVWISPFDMTEILKRLFKIWEIEKWVRVYVICEDGIPKGCGVNREWKEIIST